jgi:hypothetical protein
MTQSQIAKALAIHIAVPLLGVVLFLLLCSRMKRAGVTAPPFVPWFILFFSIGGWLLVALTALYWEWSGMASLGVSFLILVAPCLTVASAWWLHRKRSVSAFHCFAFLGSIGYSGLMFVLVLTWAGILVVRSHL